MYNWR